MIIVPSIAKMWNWVECPRAVADALHRGMHITICTEIVFWLSKKQTKDRYTIAKHVRMNSSCLSWKKNLPIALRTISTRYYTLICCKTVHGKTNLQQCRRCTIELHPHRTTSAVAWRWWAILFVFISSIAKLWNWVDCPRAVVDDLLTHSQATWVSSLWRRAFREGNLQEGQRHTFYWKTAISRTITAKHIMYQIVVVLMQE